MKTVLLCLLALGSVVGCSNRAWYEGFQQSAHQECRKNREECPEPKSYDEYKLEREKELKQK